MHEFVVDASVAVPLFLDERHSAKAQRLFARLHVDLASRLHVPDTFFAEVGASLWRAMLRGGYHRAMEDTRDLTELKLEVTSSKQLIVAAVSLSEQFLVSTYDALYLALSNKLRIPMITTDQKLLHGVHNKPFNVIGLWDIG